MNAENHSWESLMTKNIGLTRGAGIAAAAILAMAAAAPTGAADFYKGKTVKIVVGYSPGGGYDI
jgi:hypothetical protein